MIGQHGAVRWNGRQIEGGGPQWLRIAVSKGPLKPNALCRVHDTVHLFGPNGRDVVGIARPGDWILYKHQDGSLLVQKHDEMIAYWKWIVDGFYRRDGGSTSEALEAGLKIQAHRSMT